MPVRRRTDAAMWDEAKRQRFRDLRRRELEGALSEAQQRELACLTQELDDLEAAYLAPAIERLQQENTRLQAEAERLTEQRQHLPELLGQKEAYLDRIRTVVEGEQTQ
jgi:hypothetical protein